MSLLKPAKNKLIFFCDFDGTITQKDVIDLVLERYALPGWTQIEEEWKAGRIGSRECLERQMALVRIQRSELNALLDSISMDPGFEELLSTTHQFHIPVVIVSDSFDYFIGRILDRVLQHRGELRRNLQIFSSHVEFEDSRMKVFFPYPSVRCEHGCATCKVEVINNLKTWGTRSIFVGDGGSDFWAAQAADVVFAKEELLEFCRKNQMACHPYEHLDTVARWIESEMKARRLKKGVYT